MNTIKAIITAFTLLSITRPSDATFNKESLIPPAIMAAVLLIAEGSQRVKPLISWNEKLWRATNESRFAAMACGIGSGALPVAGIWAALNLFPSVPFEQPSFPLFAAPWLVYRFVMPTFICVAGYQQYLCGGLDRKAQSIPSLVKKKKPSYYITNRNKSFFDTGFYSTITAGAFSLYGWRTAVIPALRAIPLALQCFGASGLSTEEAK